MTDYGCNILVNVTRSTGNGERMQDDDPSGTSHGISRDYEALRMAKLRLEVEMLRRPWWRSASNLGPIATIAAAVFGLIWAIASGFFDVSRRDLEVRRRELEIETHALQERRDAQALKFRADTTNQNRIIAALKQEEETLRGNLAKLDKPVLLRSGYRLDSYQDISKTRLVYADLEGDNFGKGVGRVISGELYGSCEVRGARAGSQGFGTDKPVAIPISIETWSPTQVHITFKQQAVRQAFLDAVRNPIDPSLIVNGSCVGGLSVVLERADGKKSNARMIEIEGSWLDKVKPKVYKKTSPQHKPLEFIVPRKALISHQR